MMYWYGDHMNGWGYAIGLIGMILFWAVLIAAVVLVVRYFASGRGQGRPPQAPQPPQPPPSAEQTLAERFARGEIDEEEYRRRLDVLRTPSHT